ncbi:Lanthionine synthetase C-like protein [Streptococcus equinus]|uniref:Lanthionine synthetase C-like protein n=1 Tax=Streptococcus equinus TaxID=1335 RepID=A0A1H0XXW2_STREI|nr:lanthionine synthetase LanC family protein [Streptococcus equinus]SDQ07744.1 Lanthionine synthetase C-like protein [Streptococcus equinus]
MTETQTLIKPTITTEQLLQTVEGAYQYIQSKRVQTEHGIRYSLEGSANSNPYFDEISLYSGASGIIHFLLHFYEVTGDEQYLQDAEDAFPYINYRWKEARELSLAFSPWAFTTGYSGVAFAVAELYKFTQKEIYKNFIEEVVESIIEDVKESEDGVGGFWTGSFGILADSGILLELLALAQQFNREDWREFTVNVGRVLLNKGIDYEGGGRYFEGSSFGGKIIPGFPIGAAGVAYTLLKLYQASSDKAFLDATNGVKDFYHAIYHHQGDVITVPHDLPSKDPVYYLGYCGGNAGLIRYLYEDYKISGDEDDVLEIEQLVQSIVELGAPEVHSEGYWHTVAYCCGSAGLLNAFLSVWQVTRSDKYLDYAVRTAIELLKDGDYDETEEKIKWEEAYTRLEPDNISAPIGFYEGAAGVASVLLQLYSVLIGDFKVSRIVDDPFPSTY